MKIYLAGPDVFRANALEHFDVLKSLCEEYGHQGLSPFDNALDVRSMAKSEASRAIYEANLELIRLCDWVGTNLDPFHGPGVDDGTAFELGYAAALAKPLFGYTEFSGWEYPQRHHEFRSEHKLFRQYPDVEDFGKPVNLMLYEAIVASGGFIVERFEEALSRLNV